MSTLLIKSARIVDPASVHNGKVMDILIEDGIILSVKNSIKAPKGKKFEAGNLHISPGWFDMHANFRDPGLEQQETLASGALAAAHGGFTGIGLMPSTHPPLDSKSAIDYIKSRTKDFLVDVYPLGTVSKELKGKELSEMYDMFQAGALAFTDDKKSLQDSNLLKIALQYSDVFSGLILNFPNDKTICRSGVMNEGVSSTQLGLRGIPQMAEDLMIARDLVIADYCGSKIHFSTVSTARSVALIAKGKKEGKKISADVASHYLLLDDSYLKDFDSNYKVLPPLRGKSDIQALLKGLKDGTIDVICSDHSPEDEETKRREFDDAAFGIIGLETCFAAANTALRKILSIEEIINKISINPRKILGLEVPSIEEGKTANLTAFDPDFKWTFSEKDIISKSKNTPFIGTIFTGKAKAVYNKGQWMEF